MNSVIRIRDKERDQNAHPTRIAVLDTGISAEFSGSRYVKCYKDFVSHTDETYLDSTGHGTAIVRIIQMTYNAAEFYIGRVWEGATMTDRTPILMAQVSKVVIIHSFHSRLFLIEFPRQLIMREWLGKWKSSSSRQVSRMNMRTLCEPLRQQRKPASLFSPRPQIMAT